MNVRAILLPVLALGAGSLAAQNVVDVQVSPPSVTVKVGERTTLIATAYDGRQNVIPTARITWVSQNVGVARVDANGTVSGVAAGVAIIEARAGTKRATAAVQVTGGAPAPAQPAPQSTAPAPATPVTTGGVADPYWGQPPGVGPAIALHIDPPVIYLLPSENVRIAPRALKDDGSAAAPVRVDWKSLTPDIVSVNPDGVVIALAAGQGTIQATSGSLTNTAPVVVQPAAFSFAEQGTVKLAPGQSDTLLVVVPTQTNRLINPLQLQWTSSDATIVRVGLTGVITAVAPGHASISVTGLLQSKSVDILVHRAVETLAVLPRTDAELNVPLTSTRKFQVTPLAADNTAVPEAALHWSVTDPTMVAFDSSTFTLTAKKLGKTQLTVRGPGQGLSATWNVNVVPGNVRVTTPRIGLKIGGRVTLKPEFADDAGASLGPATNVTWAVDSPAVATVGEDGSVEGIAPGHARVTVTAPGGKNTTADVYVQGELLLASSRTKGKFQLYGLDRSNLADLHRVSADTTVEQEPAYSPDGSRIAYVSMKDGNPEIYVMDADGRNAARLTTDPGQDGHPAWTPDGKQIVFQSTRVAGKTQIFIMNADGSNVQQLTRDSVNLMPAVSPDGQTIAFVSTRERNYDIWLMGRDGSNQRPFTRSPLQKETEPRFLSNGQLAYLVEKKDVQNHIVEQVVRAELTTGALTPLTGTTLPLVGYAINSTGDLLALVVNAEPENRKNPVYKVYLQSGPAAAPIAIPTVGPEQMITPVFLP